MVPDQGRSGRTPQDDGNRTVRDEGLENRLRQLDAKLSKRQTVEREREAARSGKNTGWGNALRLSSEFIAAVIVGAALGWVLDKWAGTSPWGLIVFLLLGFAAGVVNVMRATGQMAEFGQQGGKDPGKGGE
ncbi:MAG: AtpZ/AtpI family protein [Zhengella sp.]|uniref:AtpZ/AtpI family protein n=1 Tax=Zhengella sp. TaxID=2282762 RepID=UPI001DFD4798|nr:AtpZ/AtpI family protein [Notoacmeibacter sp.]MCC0026171.1 AtpZ/AtpI family protein [Brucellaceae bacterium]